jgi:hypothetical protein
MSLSDPFFALLGIVAFFHVPLSAQQASCLRRTLPLTVEDSQGLPIKGLHVEDLETKFPAGPAKILSIAPDVRVHRIVMLVDASGSTGGKWRQVITTASVLAETEMHNTQIALVVFKDKIEEQISFSQGQRGIAERLRKIRSGGVIAPGGRTALYDSLLVGLQLLETPTSADSLYVLSDGADNASRAHFNEVAKRLSSSGVRLFVSLAVGQLGNRYPTPEEERGPREMSDLVKRTGGDINTPFSGGFPTKAEEVEQSSQAILRFQQEMTENYRIELELPAELDKPRKWEVRLSEGNRVRWNDARLNYPTELAPCNP